MTKHILEEGVQRILLKKKRTVIMTTDDTSLLPFADHIVVLREHSILCLFGGLSTENRSSKLMLTWSTQMNFVKLIMPP